MRPKVYRIEDLSFVIFEDAEGKSCPECTCIDDTCVDTTVCRTDTKKLTTVERDEACDLLLRAAAAMRRI